MNGNGQAPQVQPGSNALAQPGPVQVTLQQRTAHGQTWVVLLFDLPTGTAVIHLPPDMAEGLGRGLTQLGQQAKSGLIVPTPKIPPI